MKFRIGTLILAAWMMAIAVAGADFEYRVSEPMFDGTRVVNAGTLPAEPAAFTVLTTLEAAIMRDGTYAFAVRKGTADGELQWAFYRAGWNNRIGFYLNTRPKPIFIHAAPGMFAQKLHNVAATVADGQVKLYCDGKEVAAASLSGYTYTPKVGTLLLGAEDRQGKNGFKGWIAEVKVLPRTMSPKEIEYAFGTPRRPSVKVFAVPMVAPPDTDPPSGFGPENTHDALTALQVIDWRIAPESSPEELDGIARMVRQNGFDALFVGGSFRYLFAEKYGDRNWWAAMPWTTYLKTLGALDTACRRTGVKLVLHLTANLGLFPDLEREFSGMTMRELSDPGKEIDWPNYFGRPLCPNNPEFRKKYLARLEELFRAAPDLSGLMIDEVSFGPAYTGCGCSYCVAKFRERYGIQPPDPKDPKVWKNFTSPQWRDWIRFRCDSSREHVKSMTEIVQKAGKERIFTSCNYNPASAHVPTLHGIDLLMISGNLSFYEYEPFHPWSWRQGIAEGKFLTSDGRPMLVQGYSGSLSQAYFQLMLSAVMNWGNSQWTEFTGYQIVPVNWFHFWRPLSYELKPIAGTALVVSAADNMVSDYNQKNGNVPMEYFGWAEALTEAHIPFTVIRTDAIADFSKYKLLIVPNTMCWSDAELAGLQQYLAQGGRVIATGASFSLTPDGAERPLPKWTGKIKLESMLHGEKYYMPKVGGGWYGNGAAWYDDRDPQAKARMLDLFSQCHAPELTTNLPPEVVVDASEQHYRQYRGIVIRLFNLLGTRFDGGLAVPSEREYEFIDYPSPRKFIAGDKPLTITVKCPEPVSAAWMISPDFSEVVALEYQTERPGWVTVVLPDLGRYGVIYLATEDDLVRALAPEQPVTRTMPEILPFDFRYTSVR